MPPKHQALVALSVITLKLTPHLILVSYEDLTAQETILCNYIVNLYVVHVA